MRSLVMYRTAQCKCSRTWQFEHLGLVLLGKAFRQVQVGIPPVLHHIGTVQITMREPNLCPGCVQVPKHLQQWSLV